jgi:hypothetical protein
MTALRSLAQVALADARERVRRYSFLVAVGVAVYFGYLIDAGYVWLAVEHRRGVMTSAWVGTLTALSLAFFLPLLGFYLIKNTLERDRRTGVGEILAASPLSNFAYAAGKAASNLMVLAALAAVPAVAALGLQLTAGEERHLDIVALLAPLVWLTLPPLVLVAAVAVLFETVRWLRGAFGNFVFFFGWMVLLVLPVEQGVWAFDLAGLRLVSESLYRGLHRAMPPAGAGNLELQIGPRQQGAVVGTFRWVGLDWTAPMGVRIATILAAALAVVFLAALLADRFDPARRSRRAERREADAAGSAARRPPARARRLRLPHWFPGTSFGGLVTGELRLMVEGRNRWWALAAFGLLVAGFVAPMAAVRAAVLPVAWLWPLAVWSELGAREVRDGTGPLVFCGPWSVAAQALAIGCAGVLVTAAAALGPGVRMLAAGDGRGLLAWAAACVFIPSLALALGSWSGGSRLFEICYLLLWYIGPLNHVPNFDYMGVTAAARAGGDAWIWLAAAVVLVAAGIAGRRRLAQS